eukprot:TRINITY_DN11547_c1_g1_i1.p1 TRINITY_DN11547_c1_g1~~TRINITY_DN11547_c1_g1_i1.p1  ORF type:complete len:161 (-),score=24.99 TRINITY_DN11547_c1_g1_i1:138-620(-)
MNLGGMGGFGGMPRPVRSRPAVARPRPVRAAPSKKAAPAFHPDERAKARQIGLIGFPESGTQELISSLTSGVKERQPSTDFFLARHKGALYQFWMIEDRVERVRPELSAFVLVSSSGLVQESKDLFARALERGADRGDGDPQLQPRREAAGATGLLFSSR